MPPTKGYTFASSLPTIVQLLFGSGKPNEYKEVSQATPLPVTDVAMHPDQVLYYTSMDGTKQAIPAGAYQVEVFPVSSVAYYADGLTNLATVVAPSANNTVGTAPRPLTAGNALVVSLRGKTHFGVLSTGPVFLSFWVES